MVSLLNSFLWLSWVSIFSNTGQVTPKDIPYKKVECSELGLYFMVPTRFVLLDSAQLSKLEKRGQKAIKEEFNTESLEGWQPGCMNLQDSLKSAITVTSITVKEAISVNGSADKFIEETFSDGNRFFKQRLESRLGIEIDEKDAVKQSSITIAGLPVKKNVFTGTYGGTVIFLSYQYFFKKGEKLYLLGFLGSPKATDNDEVVKALEAARPIK